MCACGMFLYEFQRVRVRVSASAMHTNASTIGLAFTVAGYMTAVHNVNNRLIGIKPTSSLAVHRMHNSMNHR